MDMILGSYPSWSLLIARIVLGIIFFAHGAQKVFGWFGGPGLRGVIGYFKQSLGIPAPATVLAALIECFGGAGGRRGPVLGGPADQSLVTDSPSPSPLPLRGRGFKDSPTPYCLPFGGEGSKILPHPTVSPSGRGFRTPSPCQGEGGVRVSCRGLRASWAPCRSCGPIACA